MTQSLRDHASDAKKIDAPPMLDGTELVLKVDVWWSILVVRSGASTQASRDETEPRNVLQNLGPDTVEINRTDGKSLLDKKVNALNAPGSMLDCEGARMLGRDRRKA